jgi:2-hydroxy-3-keto-5-methylthiopentenyl-1-phosphate phosphatase
VAFAGDGPPDLQAALLVPPGLRFARGGLAEELRARGEAFQPFSRWSEIARELV